MSLIASLPATERLAAIRRIAPNRDDKAALAFKWRGWRARREQLLPPAGDWFVWLLLAGRGFGKTRTGAESVRAEIEAGRAAHVALVAPTAADVRDVMVEGESGILAVSPPWFRPLYEPSKRRLTWPNGAVAHCYSADEPERLRGPQHDLAWADELAAWRYPEAWDMLMLGLRLGRPRAIVTTTPRPTRLVRALATAPTTRLTRGSTFDNRANLAPAFLSTIIARYQGTALGRQEIEAELLAEAEGALWRRDWIEAARIDPARLPDLERVVVALDPAVTAEARSDETGLVVAGRGPGGRAFVLEDASGRMTPDEWARRAIALFDLHRADRIIGEANNGGELIAVTLRTIRPSVAYKAVHAARGKHARAEPVAALYEQRRVAHAGAFPALEDQMCNWTPGTTDQSPDRMDALVWALSELMLEPSVMGIMDHARALAGRG